MAEWSHSIRRRSLRADEGGIWVSGLPDPVRVITVGHGFVHPGQRVEAVPMSQDEGGAG